MLEKLASRMGRNDEELNIELAKTLCDTKDTTGIAEIVTGLKMDKAIASDCIKVLYEIAERNPQLVEAYVEEFVSLLSAKNNRLIWGAMTVLAWIAPVNPAAVYAHLPIIITAYETGSVITVDNSISVFAQLCKADPGYMDEIFPLLMAHLRNCRVKEIPQHAERIAPCIDVAHKELFFSVLDARMKLLSPAQQSRVKRLRSKL